MAADTAHGNDQLTEQMEQRSRSFDAWASEYERYRPGYPDALFEHIAQRLGLPEQAQVADLGAGTGKAARAMARRGWRVTRWNRVGPCSMSCARRRRARGWCSRRGPAPPRRPASPTRALTWRPPRSRSTGSTRKPRFRRGAHRSPGWWCRRLLELARRRSVGLPRGVHGLLARYVPEEHLDRQRPTEIFDTRGQLAAGGWFDVDDSVQLQPSSRCPWRTSSASPSPPPTCACSRRDCRAGAPCGPAGAAGGARAQRVGQRALRPRCLRGAAQLGTLTS